jgi:TolA-binding protein
VRLFVPVAAMAAVVLAAIVSIREHRSIVTPQTATPGIPAAQVPSPELDFDKPAVKLTAMALVLRSDGRSSRFIDEVAPALDAYRAGDYARAEADFVELAPRYPGSVEIPFYLGVSRLYLDDAGGAVAALAAARGVTGDTFRADVGWYLAVAESRTGDLASARRDADALCRGTSAYHARACAAASMLAGR